MGNVELQLEETRDVVKELFVSEARLARIKKGVSSRIQTLEKSHRRAKWVKVTTIVAVAACAVGLAFTPALKPYWSGQMVVHQGGNTSSYLAEQVKLADGSLGWHIVAKDGDAKQGLEKAIQVMNYGVWLPSSTDLQMKELEYVERAQDEKYLRITFHDPNVGELAGKPSQFLISLTPNPHTPIDPQAEPVKTAKNTWYKAISNLPQLPNWVVYDTDLDAGTHMSVGFPPGYPDQISVLNSMMPILKK